MGNTLQLLGFIFKAMTVFSSGGNTWNQLCQRKIKQKHFLPLFPMSTQNQILPIVILFVFNFSLNSAYFCLLLLLSFSILKHFLPLVSRAASTMLTSLAVAPLLSLFPPYLCTLTSPWGLALRSHFFLSALTPFVHRQTHMLIALKFVSSSAFCPELQILKYNFLLYILTWVTSSKWTCQKLSSWSSSLILLLPQSFYKWI